MVGAVLHVVIYSQSLHKHALYIFFLHALCICVFSPVVSIDVMILHRYINFSSVRIFFADVINDMQLTMTGCTLAENIVESWMRWSF
jgi:hypothetical protein